MGRKKIGLKVYQGEYRVSFGLATNVVVLQKSTNRYRSMKQMMLGLSWFTNYEAAIRTLSDFGNHVYLRAIPTLAIGVETEADRNGALKDGTPVFRILIAMARLNGLQEVWLWDRQSDLTAKRLWPASLPSPLLDGYSYGGAVVRMRLLAIVANRDYLVRVDPGCFAPPDFAGLLARHFKLLHSGTIRIASGRYTGRIALRTHFVNPSRVDEFLDLVAKFTGIDPRKQLTGGAACTFHKLAPPPWVFDKALIWASDDGALKNAFPEVVYVDEESQIPRDEPGFSMPLTEYFVRVAGAAGLNELVKGKPAKAAMDKSVEFLNAMARLVASDEVNLAEGTEKLGERLPRIEAGIKLHQTLVKSWPDIIEAVHGMDDLRRTCRIA